MKIITIFMLIVTSSLLAAEPSVYGAGNLESSSPYGLTSGEKNILKNRANINKMTKNLNTLKLKLSNISESYEGVKSVTEGTGFKISKIDKSISNLTKGSLKSEEDIKSLRNDVNELKLFLDQNKEIQNTNQENVKKVLSELGSLIDSINNNYVSKESFKSLEKKQLELEQQLSSLSKSLARKKKTSISRKSGSVLLSEGLSLFKKKNYNEAKLRFSQLVNKNYKPSRSNFYLGEIAYAQKSYQEAISYYKKSIALYDKANYTPTLLYHTGISFSKLKQNSNAKQFFDTLKESYPNSKEAKSLN